MACFCLAYKTRMFLYIFLLFFFGIFYIFKWKKEKEEEEKEKLQQKFPLWLSSLRTRLVSMQMLVWSLALLSGLRIHHCHERWYRSQMWLGSGVAVAIAAATFRLLAWEPSYAVGVAPCLKKKKKAAAPRRPYEAHKICNTIWPLTENICKHLAQTNHDPPWGMQKGLPSLSTIPGLGLPHHICVIFFFFFLVFCHF